MNRRLQDLFCGEQFANERAAEPLPYLVNRHNSLIRRRLGNVDLRLQENKAVNLSIAAPKISGVLIRPGEVFSLWKLVGSISRRKGYCEGLMIAHGATASGTGGGMCQLSNLIHWMILHTPMTIVEHHHHDGIDLFPDFNRQIPFGTGTSILYNYLDYRVKNMTGQTYQLIVHTGEEYLKGEIRSDQKQSVKYHIRAEGERFVRENGVVYRVGEVWREAVDVCTGQHIGRELLRKNHARVLYDTAALTIEE